MEQRAMSYHSQGLSRALDALRVLSKSGKPLTLAELSRTLDLPKPTLLRILAVMEEQEFIRKEGDPPTYSIGHGILEIADAYTPVDIAAVAAPVMQDLAAELGFTTNLGILEGRSVLHLHVEEPQRSLRFASSGSLDFTYCTGLGKMLLSAIPAEELDQHLPEIEPYEIFTPETITSRSGLESELAKIRQQGYTVDDEERNRGVTCLAVPILSTQPFIASLSISAPSGELRASEQLRCLPTINKAASVLASNPEFVAALGILRKLQSK